MENYLYWIFALGLCLLLVWSVKRWRKSHQGDYIDQYKFHQALDRRLSDKRPELSEGQRELVFVALREYFHLCQMAPGKPVAMPSQVVDDLWHEFILFTKAYQQFCRRAFGRYLHHTPVEAMATATTAGEGIKRAWRLACDREGIDPKNPKYLPLIFAIDGQFNLQDGFLYQKDCKDPRSPTFGSGYCASHIGCASGCSGSSGSHNANDGNGWFDGFGDSGGGSGCGGD